MQATKNGEVLIFSCAGAAYSGQVSNRAAAQLARDGVGNLFCIAAVAADRPDKLNRARNAGKRIAIDGCEDACCRHILEQHGLPVDLHLVATDLGVEKKPETPHDADDAFYLVEHVKKVMATG